MNPTHRLRFARPLLAALLVAVVARSTRAQTAGIPVGAHAPNATVETLDGTPVDLAQYVGKGPVVLEFWATWCPLCRKLEPAMQAAQAKYPHVRFVSVGVPQNQTPERQREYAEKQQLKGTFVFDRDGKAIAAYQVPHTSYVVVIDAGGTVVYTGVGPEQDVDAAVSKVAK
jgi:peroxiredoxin